MGDLRVVPKGIRPDAQVAEEFLTAMYGPGSQTCFQIFPESSGDVGMIHPEWRYGTLNQHLPWLLQANTQGAGIFFTVNASDGKGRKTENITAITHLFVDLDGADPKPLAALGAPPHIITQSSPGRYQAFWRVTDLPIDQFTPYQKALAAKFKGDPAVVDPPRVMRLPGFLHQKKEPFLSTIHRRANLKPWAPSLLKTILGLSVKNGTPAPIFTATESEAEKFPEGQRHRCLLTVISRLRNSGLSGEALLTAAEAVNQSKCSPPLPLDEIQKLSKYFNKKDQRSIDPYEEPRVFEKLPTKHMPPDVETFQDVWASPYVPVKWIVEDLLPVGLTILAGDPKAGKSYLAQHLSIAVASGTEAMGMFRTVRGDVLSLSLEDSRNRFKQRLHKLLQDSPPPEGAYFARKWAQLPEGIGDIRKWAKSVANPALVVIDTLARIRGIPKKWDSSGIYERDYQQVSQIQEIAQDFQLAIIVIHHLNKGEQTDDFRRISGSQGITGASDSNWVLATDRESMTAKLSMVGREIRDTRYFLKMDTESGIWKCLGTADQYAMSETQERVIEAMVEIDQPASAAQIGEHMGISRQAAVKTINALLQTGVVQKSVTGKYMLAPGAKG